VRLQLRGGGAFPTPRRATVYWLGVDDGDALAFLHEAVMDATLGFVSRRDRVPFHPHLTLARLRSKLDLTADVDALAGAPIGPPWTATDVHLMESRTERGGAVYTEIARIALGGR
jgi:2'-5' RNA ligase